MIRQPAFATSGVGGTFPCVRALEIIRDVCKGMAYLHGKSPPTLHGDLTSSNILLRSVVRNFTACHTASNFQKEVYN